jgi:hypothetical protein
MEDSIRSAKCFFEQIRTGNTSPDKFNMGLRYKIFDIFLVSREQVIQDYHFVLTVYEFFDNMRPDKSCPAGNNVFHGIIQWIEFSETMHALH